MKFSIGLSAFACLITIIGPVNATDTPCDPISKYSTEWFLDNTKSEWRTKSFDSTALFYSSGLSARAKEFARQTNKITIWEVWPCENYLIRATRQNPLRCIMSNFEDEMTYFENMSRAFAMKAHHLASVMHRNIENPPMSTIWGRIELPVLQSAGNPGGVVDYITAIDAEDIGRQKIAWIRNLPGRLMTETESIIQRILHARDLEDAAESIEKREDFGACPIESDSSHPLW